METEGTIDITPTPEGYRRIKQVFEQQIAQSESLIEDAEAMQYKAENPDANREFARMSDDQLRTLREACDALIERENDRIRDMRTGIADPEKGIK